VNTLSFACPARAFYSEKILVGEWGSLTSGPFLWYAKPRKSRASKADLASRYFPRSTILVTLMFSFASLVVVIAVLIMNLFQERKNHLGDRPQ
jgi:hypothetical protein